MVKKSIIALFLISTTFSIIPIHKDVFTALGCVTAIVAVLQVLEQDDPRPGYQNRLSDLSLLAGTAATMTGPFYLGKGIWRVSKTTFDKIKNSENKDLKNILKGVAIEINNHRGEFSKAAASFAIRYISIKTTINPNDPVIT